MLLSMLTPVYASADYYPEKEHADIAYSDMELAPYDDEGLNNALDELGLILSSEDGNYGDYSDFDSALEGVVYLYYQVNELFKALMTQNTLWAVRYYSDPNDEEALEQMTDYELGVADISDKICITMKSAVGTEFEVVMQELIGADSWEKIKDYEPMTDRERELKALETELIQQYGAASIEDYSATVNGREWSFEKLSEELPDTYEEYIEVINAVYRAKTDALGPYLIELIKIRNEIAELKGYDSYAEYAYEETYARDYSPDELPPLYEAVKKNFVPVLDKLYDLLMIQDSEALQSFVEGKTGDEIVREVEPYIKHISPELGEAYDGLMNLGLYDIDASASKQNVGFTSELPSYGYGFIFNCPGGDYYDYVTLIHEFGHFNFMWHDTEDYLWTSQSYDLMEVHSQALTLLFLKYAPDLFGDGAGAYDINLLYQIVSAVLSGCMYDEFQQRIYAEDDLTVDDLNRIFCEISSQYGYYYDDDITEAYYWVDVSHNFESPFYYISYGTSALASLGIWAVSQADWDAAVDSYMKISAMSGVDFKDALNEAGLDNVLDPEMAELIAQIVSVTIFGESDGLLESLAPEGSGIEYEHTNEPISEYTNGYTNVYDDIDPDFNRFSQNVRNILFAVSFILAAVFVLKLLLAIVLLIVRVARSKKKPNRAEHSK